MNYNMTYFIVTQCNEFQNNIYHICTNVWYIQGCATIIFCTFNSNCEMFDHHRTFPPPPTIILDNSLSSWNN